MKDIKKTQLKLQKINIIKHEIKNYSSWNLLADLREQKISKCYNMVIKTERKNILKNEKSISELLENIEWPSMHVLKLPEQRREQGL